MKRERCSCMLLASTGPVYVIMRHNRSLQVFKLLNSAHQCRSSLSELLQHHQCNSMQWSQSKKRNNKTNATIIIRRSVPNSLDVLVFMTSPPIWLFFFFFFVWYILSKIWFEFEYSLVLKSGFNCKQLLYFFGWITCCKRKVKGSGITLYMNWLDKFADPKEKLGGLQVNAFRTNRFVFIE